MWNLWWIFIGSVVIFVALLVLCIVTKGFWFKVKREKSVYNSRLNDGWGGYEWQIVEEEEECAALTVILVITVVLSIILLPICILVPPSYNSDVERLITEREAIVSMYDDRELFDSLSVTEKVVKYNERVADIKSRASIYGNWSGYCNSRYKDLELIVIEKS